MSIACFGASVTQQKRGYPYFLSKLMKCEMGVFGYGDENMLYSGVTYINDVLKVKPDICFIDWFSTGYTSKNLITTNILNTIKYKFTTNNCKLVFLFFAHEDHANRIPFYDFLKRYLVENNLSYIDLNEYIQYDKKIIRDNVHTTEYGSELYAKLIFEQFNNMGIKKPINVEKTYLCDIKELNINKVFKSKIVLNGNCTILACRLIIGPKSGHILCDRRKFDIWDHWCHYERKCSKLNNVNVNDEIVFKVLDESVDYSTCKREFDFGNPSFELNIITIYYIGDRLEFVEGK